MTRYFSYIINFQNCIRFLIIYKLFFQRSQRMCPKSTLCYNFHFLTGVPGTGTCATKAYCQNGVIITYVPILPRVAYVLPIPIYATTDFCPSDGFRFWFRIGSSRIASSHLSCHESSRPSPNTSRLHGSTIAVLHGVHCYPSSCLIAIKSSSISKP